MIQIKHPGEINNTSPGLDCTQQLLELLSCHKLKSLQYRQERILGYSNHRQLV